MSTKVRLACCNKWVDHIKANGFGVRSHDTDNVAQHKARLGVPPGYGACHTAEVGGYVIEGHVPAREIKRLLKEKNRVRAAWWYRPCRSVHPAWKRVATRGPMTFFS